MKTDYLVGKLTIKILNLFLGAKNQTFKVLRSYPPFRKERWYAFSRLVGFFVSVLYFLLIIYEKSYQNSRTD